MGSKGINRKNLQKLGNRSLLEWAVLAGKELSTEVYVSSESSEIHDICSQKGWKFLRRPTELASDFATDYDYLSYHLESDLNLEQKDNLVLMRPTSPLRTRTALKKLGNLLKSKKHNFTSIRSVVTAENTPYKMWYKHNDYLTKLPLENPDRIVEPFNSPRQKLPKVFWQTGTYDVYKIGSIVEGRLSGEKILGFEADHPEVDIDSIDDLSYATKLYEDLKQIWI